MICHWQQKDSEAVILKGKEDLRFKIPDDPFVKEKVTL